MFVPSLVFVSVLRPDPLALAARIAAQGQRTPRGRFYVHLKTNYQAARPTANVTVNGPSNQRNPRQEAYQFWDAEVSYRLRPKLTLLAVARNLTSERPNSPKSASCVTRSKRRAFRGCSPRNTTCDG
jgi:outer membrane receptor protein involved in Fe transport